MVELLVFLVIAGFVVWLVNVLIPMDPKFRTVINALVGLFLFLYLLSAFGLINLPRIRG